MPIIRQGGEIIPADDNSPSGVVAALRAYIAAENAPLPRDHKRRIPLVGQFRGLGFERIHGPYFVTLVGKLGGLCIPIDEAQALFDQLDAHRTPPEDDPEQRITPASRAAINALPHNPNHLAVQVGEHLIEGLAAERSPAVRWADEALLAIRMNLSQAQVEDLPYIDPITESAAA